ncbi:MAG: hypothetical protein M5R36_29585 [Deltaproteobacteria bacterium]|nr:hypothetical protein [Deltaproteobacteria bacterium]
MKLTDKEKAAIVAAEKEIEAKRQEAAERIDWYIRLRAIRRFRELEASLEKWRMGEGKSGTSNPGAEKE